MEGLLTAEDARFLETARVGHLATADAGGRPHVVPVVFVFDRGRVYTPIDGKPKGDPRKLRRLRNILENPRVTFLVDRYEEDWTRLAFVLIQGTAAVLRSSALRPAAGAQGPVEDDEYGRAEALLRRKYPQYASVPLGGPEGQIIRITPERCTTWGRP